LEGRGSKLGVRKSKEKTGKIKSLGRGRETPIGGENERHAFAQERRNDYQKTWINQKRKTTRSKSESRTTSRQGCEENYFNVLDSNTKDQRRSVGEKSSTKGFRGRGTKKGHKCLEIKGTERERPQENAWRGGTRNPRKLEGQQLVEGRKWLKVKGKRRWPRTTDTTSREEPVDQ